MAILYSNERYLRADFIGTIYFNISISIAVIGGTILGPIVFLYSTEWAILYAGLFAGTIAFLLGGKSGE